MGFDDGLRDRKADAATAAPAIAGAVDAVQALEDAGEVGCFDPFAGVADGELDGVGVAAGCDG
ncbi:MAG TPA: hypothetical protein VLN26_14415, partial [Gaiellaceae bacterium]|nr:hypothetical protein [Gaiellaceae bacterium]